MFGKNLLIAASIMAGMGSVAYAETTPEAITVAGGLTNIPLMIKAGEEFVTKSPQYKSPIVLNNNTATGFKLFCAGSGADTASLNTATRNIEPTEIELCNKNGVTNIVQLVLGNNAMVLAQGASGRLTALSRKEFFLAIAKDVPDPKDSTKLIANPYKTWKDINPAWADTKIQVTAPTSGLGLYQTYIKAIVLVGCRQVDYFKNLESSNPKDFEVACKSFRKDGYSDYEQIATAVQEVKVNPDIMGVLPFTSVLKENLKPLTLDNMEPTALNISRNIYGVTFPLVVFLKKSHVGLVPGLKEYLAELVSEKATGLTGYFYDMGVIPLPLNDRKKYRAEVEALNASGRN